MTVNKTMTYCHNSLNGNLTTYCHNSTTALQLAGYFLLLSKR